MQRRENVIVGVIEVLGEVDFRPGKTRGVLGSEAACLNENTKDVVVGIGAARTKGFRLGLGDQGGKVAGIDLEEADGFAN